MLKNPRSSGQMVFALRYADQPSRFSHRIVASLANAMLESRPPRRLALCSSECQSRYCVLSYYRSQYSKTIVLDSSSKPGHPGEQHNILRPLLVLLDCPRNSLAVALVAHIACQAAHNILGVVRIDFDTGFRTGRIPEVVHSIVHIDPAAGTLGSDHMASLDLPRTVLEPVVVTWDNSAAHPTVDSICSGLPCRIAWILTDSACAPERGIRENRTGRGLLFGGSAESCRWSSVLVRSQALMGQGGQNAQVCRTG